MLILDEKRKRIEEMLLKKHTDRLIAIEVGVSETTVHKVRKQYEKLHGVKLTPDYISDSPKIEQAKCSLAQKWISMPWK